LLLFGTSSGSGGSTAGHVSAAPGLGAVPDVGPAAAAAQQRGGGEEGAAGGARGLAEGRKWLEGLDFTLVTLDEVDCSPIFGSQHGGFNGSTWILHDFTAWNRQKQ